MAETYNGICKASALPLLVQQFGLKPNERVENWWSGTGARFRECASGRIFFIDLEKLSCNELARESVPAYVLQIVAESDDELCERYFRIHGGKSQDPNEFLAAHSEMASRGISTLDTLDRLRNEKR